MPAKSSSRDKNKKLTDFFARRSSTSAPPLATSSSRAGSTTATISTTRGPATRASTAAVDRESSVNISKHAFALVSIYLFPSGAPSQVLSPSTMTTRKRARSPDGAKPIISSFPPTKLKSARKPSDAGRQTAVVYVPSPYSSCNSLAQRRTPVKVHNSLVTSPLDSSEQVVSSSQSDEAELVLPIPERRDFGRVAGDVHTWRRKTFESSNSSLPCEDAMEVDLFSSSSIRSSPLTNIAWSSSPPFGALVPSAEMSRSNTGSPTPIVASACLPSSPDTNDLSPLPPTPEPIDPETKTTKLIAEIKAKAFAANQSSDDSPPLSFYELEDSDDGDLLDEASLFRGTKERRYEFWVLMSRVLSPNPCHPVPNFPRHEQGVMYFHHHYQVCLQPSMARPLAELWITVL